MAATIVIRIPKRIQDRSAFTCHCPFPFPSLVPSLSVHRPSRAARSNGITIGSASATPPASQGAPFNSIFSSVRGTLFISRLLVPVSSLLSFLSPPISRALLSSRSISSPFTFFYPRQGVSTFIPSLFQGITSFELSADFRLIEAWQVLLSRREISEARI